MTSVAAVVETTIADLKLVRRGKVRDVYEVDDACLLIVATDRISAFVAGVKIGSASCSDSRRPGGSLWPQTSPVL